MSSRARISIKRLLVVLLAILGVLVAALSFITTRQLDSATQRAESEQRRFESIRLADSLRKSSDDLTNMVRLYVTTGQPRYRRYYDELLAIRSGYAPRPRQYDAAFWDRVLSGGKARRDLRPAAVAHRAHAPGALRRHRVRGAQRRAANLQSPRRHRARRHAPRRRADPRGIDGSTRATSGPSCSGSSTPSTCAKSAGSWRRSSASGGLVEARTAAEADRFAARNDRWLAAQVAILALIVAAGVAALFVIGRLAIRPLGS